MSFRPKGKYVTINDDMPQALGICDYSGFVFRKIDLMKQMEWRGNALIWTGFLVGRPYVDKPNEQLRPPILPPDPVPVQLPRLQQPQYVTWSMNQPVSWSNITVDYWVDWSGSEDGVVAPPNEVRLQQLETAYFGAGPS